MSSRSRNRNEKKPISIYVLVCILIVIAIVIVSLIGLARNKKADTNSSVSAEQVTEEEATSQNLKDSVENQVNAILDGIKEEETAGETGPQIAEMKTLNPESLDSDFALMLRVSDNKVLFEKNGYFLNYPASLTKMMTLIVATEHLDLDQMVTVTEEDVQKAIDNQLSRAGFEAGETVTVRDLLYGAMLPSGAECCHALSRAAAGSEEAFAEMMNQKVAEMGFTTTHFLNASGMHQDDHYSCCYEMAEILRYIINNPVLKDFVTAKEHKSTATSQHPDGLLVSSTVGFAFDGVYEMSNGAIVKGGKTGTTDEAGRCLCSFAEYQGEEYIFVSTNAPQREQGGQDKAAQDAVKAYNSLYIPS